MKNIGKITTALSASILFALGACQELPKKGDPEGPGNGEKVKPPKGIVSLEESKSLYDNYSRNRADLIQKYEMDRDPDGKFKPARFAEFNFEEIKQYMAYIEQEAKDADVEIGSLRFYFANYPKEAHFPDGRKVVHPRQNSIIIVPTMEVDGGQWGFYIGADGKAKQIRNAVENKNMGQGDGETARASLFPTPVPLQDPKSLNLNHGDSGPPPDTDFDD